MCLKESKALSFNVLLRTDLCANSSHFPQDGQETRLTEIEGVCVNNLRDNISKKEIDIT